ncbi:Myb-like DNA-binding domain containing protein [Trichomonas vaginalis G3]|uniref:Myb-like DNA-binding domain containing protein n=1 Tax=Trichomonas vaginalis (strain ATCC PRA-98 / G3) TaxID=412133 RepID=A2GH82_TRIV3|nr:RNA polymerase II transcription regulator recruiting protein [Trichomonas vaginalis G3]EAX83484.1 Myb-like DNA-binding domain containing protein [Trichomonas vaginalis G3]KAI5538679.1 RNA polymerase II transcription regulator recruiting protein [Trichomonas vaginalis G3]|eukprot:XP_001296414.1 Myb-like DNA-binding domain containing protein [Trichomonas vaginalis G3]
MHAEHKETRKPRHKFTEEEDKLIRQQIAAVGEGNWTLIAKVVPGRTARQCRERWINYLSPNVANTPWTEEEDRMLENLVETLGTKWCVIAKQFPRRTDVLIKNRWSLLNRRKIKKQKKIKSEPPLSKAIPPPPPENRPEPPVKTSQTQFSISSLISVPQSNLVSSIPPLLPKTKTKAAHVSVEMPISFPKSLILRPVIWF